MSVCQQVILILINYGSFGEGLTPSTLPINYLGRSVFEVAHSGSPPTLGVTVYM